MMLWLRRRKDLHCSLASSCRAELGSLASWTLRNKGCLQVTISNGEFRGTPEALWENKLKTETAGVQASSGEFRTAARSSRQQWGVLDISGEFKTVVRNLRQ
jgi:hypothetical protein